MQPKQVGPSPVDVPLWSAALWLGQQLKEAAMVILSLGFTDSLFKAYIDFVL